MNTNTKQEWISVNERLPETDTQHRNDFESVKVSVWTDEGLATDQYVRRYKSTSGGLKLISEGWLYESNVKYWFIPEPPSENT